MARRGGKTELTEKAEYIIYMRTDPLDGAKLFSAKVVGNNNMAE